MNNVIITQEVEFSYLLIVARFATIDDALLALDRLTFANRSSVYHLTIEA
jgi:hypothetical protein